MAKSVISPEDLSDAIREQLTLYRSDVVEITLEDNIYSDL